MAIEKAIFLAVLLLLAAITALRGQDELIGVGRAMAISQILMFVFLMATVRARFRACWTAHVVVLWTLWVAFCSIATAPTTNMYEWLALQFLPVMLWPLHYLTFYTYARLYPRALRLIVPYFFLIAIGTVLMFFLSFERHNVAASRFMQLNAVYYPLLALPWLMLAKERLLRFTVMAFVVVAVFYSFKRTALLALALMALTYLWIERDLIPRRIRLLRIPIASAAICLAVVVFFRIDSLFDETFSGRIANVFEDEGSGRLEIYRDVITKINNSSVKEALIGHGYYSTEQHFGCTAHNDWLEVMFDYGMVGLGVYGLLHLSLVMQALRLVRDRSPYAAAYASSYVAFAIFSIISHLIIYPTYFVYIVTLWGCVDGLTSVERPPAKVLHRQRLANPAYRG